MIKIKNKLFLKFIFLYRYLLKKSNTNVEMKNNDKKNNILIIVNKNKILYIYFI